MLITTPPNNATYKVIKWLTELPVISLDIFMSLWTFQKG